MTRYFAIGAFAILVLVLGGTTALILQGRSPLTLFQQPSALGGAGLVQNEDAYAQCRSTVIAGGSDTIGGPFELITEDGALVTSEALITEPTLLYFGYTFCPDVCPLDTVRNAEVVDILAARGEAVLPVFISIDPKRDTLERLREFTENIHPDMIGLTGSDAQVAAASRAYRTYYNSHDDGSDPYYLVDHSTFTYLVLPDAGFVEFFRRDTAPAEMADAVQCFLDASS